MRTKACRRRVVCMVWRSLLLRQRAFCYPMIRVKRLLQHAELLVSRVLRLNACPAAMTLDSWTRCGVIED